MAIDWKKYAPSDELSDLQVSLVLEITRRFLDTGDGTSFHEKKVRLDKRWRELVDLVNKIVYVKNYANRLYPAFQALYFEPATIQTRVEAAVESILKALKILYQASGSTGQHDLEHLSGAIKQHRLGDYTAVTIRRGAQFLPDFQPLYLANIGWRPDGSVSGVWPAGDSILDFDSVEDAWDRVWAQRNVAAASAVPHRHPTKRAPEREDFALVWALLHPTVVRMAKDRFESRHFADSVEACLKELNDTIQALVRERTNEEFDGSDLMNRAFSPKKPVITLDDLKSMSGRDIQIGYMQIFAGSMTGIRNPKAHKNVEIDSRRAIHLLFLVSLLFFKLDERTA